MKKIIFATSNPNKVSEVSLMIDLPLQVLSLQDIDYSEEIEETGKTFEENALLKAKTIYENQNYTVFAEDSGLEIEALNQEPGIYTARYAGPERNADKNMDLVLEKLKNENNRKARFVAVIAYIDKNREVHYFKGIIPGKIAQEKTGKGGFGYDPIFIPEGHNRSFAEMTKDEKKSMSHRGRAIKKLVDHLKNTPYEVW